MFSFVPSTSESWRDFFIVLPGLTMIGIGLGITFSSTNVGAMGAVSGQELGLASGIVNTARQLGAAIGIALLVATMVTASRLHRLEYAKEDIDGKAIKGGATAGDGAWPPVCGDSPTTPARRTPTGGIPGPASTRSPPGRQRARPVTPTARASGWRR